MLYSMWLVLLLGLIHVTPNKAASVRLVNGSYSCSGRVEVLYDGQWGTVCDDKWDSPDAEVVCREMGCGLVEEAPKAAFFGEGSSPVLITKVECASTESSLLNCKSQRWQIDCDHTRDAGVICAPNVRLIDGFDSCSGRVEVFKDGQWGTVCDDDWDLSDAAVVCREVGCGDAVEAKRGGYYGQGSGGPIKMHGVNCVGDEFILSTCVSDNGAVDPAVCDISKAAGVICKSLTRLVNSDKSCYGRVEVYHAGEWGTVCDGGWDANDGTVLCREVGCGGVVAVIKDAGCGKGSGPVWTKDLACSNSESMLRYCNSKEWGGNVCEHQNDAGINCDYPVRLTGGSTCSGAVEVYRGGVWGPVCYDGWDLKDAEVVCRELGCGEVLEINSAPKPPPAVMNNVSCDGSESSLMRCGWSAKTCSSNLRATVTCRLIKVVNGPSKCSGTVQMFYGGNWATVCDDYHVQNMQVACKELGCWDGTGHIVAKANFYSVPITTQTIVVNCNGNENTLSQCNPSFGNYCDQAGVMCVEMIYKYSLRIEVTGDPNDPATRDIILRKIQEKLPVDKKITLNWKTQSNGNIFQSKNTFYP